LGFRGSYSTPNDTLQVMIRNAKFEDLPGILRIYNYVVKTSAATFDLKEQTIEERRNWFFEHGERYPLIVAEQNGQVIGYSSLSKFRDKPGYNRTVESSVYVEERFQGMGIGKRLMREILDRAVGLGYHVVIAGIAGGNERSERLHLSLGFQCIGFFKEVGFKFGSWQDVSFYRKQLS
jgi:L-amino acid N-acyltransferase YncA